jgi:pimeloyl-ACP methyl ester carboxylesterase
MPDIYHHEGTARSVRIRVGTAGLEGDLVMPTDSRGIVLFAHGSGSSRLSPRNQWVARQLQGSGFATLLFDLLTPAEERLDAETGALRFNIELLAQRLTRTTDWVAYQKELSGLGVGYFGASTGGAAALVAAAQRPQEVRAVVSRGGRPDLAGPYLEQVRAPTLLIVGGHDVPVIAMNRTALAHLRLAPKQLVIVPGAGHLFEEPGALDQVADLARDWFSQHLGAATAAGAPSGPANAGR